MRVLVIPSDYGGCGHYRCHWPARSVAQSRPDWEVLTVSTKAFQFGIDQRNKLRVRGPSLEGVDLIHMQRPGKPITVRFVQWLQEQGIAVSIDFDDAFWCIDRDNHAFASWNGAGRDGQHWRHCDEAANLADVVTVTTKYLADRYGRHGRVEIIPNYVPGKAHTTPELLAERQERRRNDAVRIGWAGTMKVHPHDLSVVGDSVARAVKELGAEFHVIGDGNGVARALGLSDSDIHVHGYQGFQEYHEALDTFDIGIVPLEDSRFNKAKSSLKMTEYAARGLAVIGSATPANRKLAGSVLTYSGVAYSEKQWFGGLKSLVQSRDLLEKTQELTLQQAQSLTVETHSDEWAAAWSRAVNRRRTLDS